MAVLLAMLALLVAIGSAFLSWQALDRSSSASSELSGRKLLDRQAYVAENASQRAFSDIPIAVNGDSGAASIGMAQDVVTAGDPGDLETVPLQSVRTPHAVLVAFDDDRHGYGPQIGHPTTIAPPGDLGR